MSNYREFIESKLTCIQESGFESDKSTYNKNLFEWQRDIVHWALRKGKACLFEDCGLGKTLQQLSFAEEVCKHTGGNVLILAPLAVASQTKAEGVKFGIDVNICRKQCDVKKGINITNYEMIEHFQPETFEGIILDESSILKNSTGATKTALTEMFKNTPYKLCCTATPAPNDFMEIGNHLVVMRKPGDNPEPVTHTNESFPVEIWQKYASPIWTDINPSDTLQYRSARDNEDEKHICPLQLTVIRRALNLWTNSNDIVLTPFMGIGSEVVTALENGRRAIGVELKDSYYKQAEKNARACTANEQLSLW